MMGHFELFFNKADTFPSLGLKGLYASVAAEKIEKQRS